jgi:riboflavin kinase/FMN adenylyltransferase
LEGTTLLAGGMLNIGRRPTVDVAGAAQTIEVNLLGGFSGDLYGRQLQLLFVARLRDEQQFAGIEALKEQLGKDATAAAKVLGL